MFKKRYGKRAFKKKFTRKFPVRKRTFNKTKYGNRRFSKPTFKQTIKYSKLEDMIRNKVVVKKFTAYHTERLKGSTMTKLTFNVEEMFETTDIKYFISEFTEFSLTSFVIQHTCLDTTVVATHIDKQSMENHKKGLIQTPIEKLLTFPKTFVAGPMPAKFKQKFNLAATHKYNRTSPWMDVKTFLSYPSGKTDYSTLFPDLPYTQASNLPTSQLGQIFIAVTFTISCRNYKTDKIGFSGLSSNHAEGLVNLYTANKNYVSDADAALLLTSQIVNRNSLNLQELDA